MIVEHIALFNNHAPCRTSAMIRRHTPTAHAAYHDLIAALKDEAVAEFRGAPTRVERQGRIYWYDTYRVGADVRKRYVGEDTPDLRRRIDHVAELKAQAADRRSARARLIRILRAEGFIGLDPTTGSMMNALAVAGVFRLGGTIVGTHAFRLYEGVLGLRFSFDQLAQTGDIDIASFERLSLALDDVVSPPLQTVLAEFDFAPAPSIDARKTWRWRQTKGEMLVEFLTPSFSEEEDLRPLPSLGIDAQALHHLNYVLADPIQAAAVYRSGVLIQIPRPERFAIHKLIVADRRRGDLALKAEKDRRQAAFLIEALAEDRPDDLAEAYRDAMDAGPRWRERLDRTLDRMPETRRQINATLS